MKSGILKRIICVSLALAMLLSFAACGEDETNPTKTDSNVSSSSEEVVSETESVVSEETSQVESKTESTVSKAESTAVSSQEAVSSKPASSKVELTSKPATSSKVQVSSKPTSSKVQAGTNTSSKVQAGTNSVVSNTNSTVNEQTNSSTNKNNNKVNYNFIDTTIGANGKDYKNYNPYADIEKYRGTKVKFATWIDHQSTEGKEPIESFKEKYGIDVELVYCSQNNYVEEILALIAANNAPDIFVNNSEFPTILQIAQDFSVTGVDLNEPVWSKPLINASSVGNKVYAVNTYNSVWNAFGLTVYNRELMEANGIKTPADYYKEGNWTWETMEKVASDVKALGEDYYGGSIDLFQFVGSLGGQQISYDYKSATFKNTLIEVPYVEGQQYLADFTKRNLDGNMNKLTEGKLGFVITGPYGIKKTGYFRTMDPLDIGVTYIPSKDKNTKAITTCSLRSYGIVRTAKNPKAAGMFIRYFLDPANYDLDKAFVSKEVTKFYFELCEQAYQYSKNNEINIQHHGIAPLTGESQWTWIDVSGDPSQIPNLLAQKKNVMDPAIKKANEMLKNYK